MKKYVIFTLFLITVLGGFLRIYNLSHSPPSLNWDEAALGYNAYSVSKTLKDEYKKTLPFFTRSFDEYKSMLPVYLMIPSISIFGLNEVGVRFPSSLMGTLEIILIYLISRCFFKSEKIALVSALVFAIEPWSIELSRVYQEANTALFFLLMGLLMYLYSKRRNYLLPFSVIFLMLSMYSYNSNKILIPLLLIVIVSINWKELKRYNHIVKKISLLILTFFLVIFAFLAISGQALARAGSTNIFILWPITDVLKPLKESHVLGGVLGFLFHNQYFYFLWEIIGRYISYFSPMNLFIREPLEPSTKVPDNSLFYPFEFIPWIVGLYFLITRRSNKKEFLSLMILSPIPAIFTWNWFHPGRVMSLFALYSILISVGIVETITFISRRLYNLRYLRFWETGFYVLFSVLALLSAFFLFDAINVQLPIRDSGNWQPGFRETVPSVVKEGGNYKTVVIETPHAQPYIFYLFYGKYDPAIYQDELDLIKIGTPRKVYDFGKYEFRKIDWFDDKNRQNTLFVGNENNLPDMEISKDKNVNLILLVKDSLGNVVSKLVGTK